MFSGDSSWVVAARDWWVKRVVDMVEEPMDMTLKQKVPIPIPKNFIEIE